MPTRNLTRDDGIGAGVGITWTGLLNGDDGQAFDTLMFGDVCVQVLGTFGVGGNLRIEGSNEKVPTTWATLTDPQANSLDFTAAKIEQLLEMPRWIRPRITAGDGTTSLSCIIWARRTR